MMPRITKTVATKKKVTKKAAKKKVVRAKKPGSGGLGWDPKALKKGDTVLYKNVGYGLTTYEWGRNDVQKIKGQKLFTDTFDSFGMDWDEATGTWKFDGGLGLVCYVVDPNDQVAKREADEYEEAIA
jgi:hypothetical protein